MLNIGGTVRVGGGTKAECVSGSTTGASIFGSGLGNKAAGNTVNLGGPLLPIVPPDFDGLSTFSFSTIGGGVVVVGGGVGV